jgi:hypothetical protein
MLLGAHLHFAEFNLAEVIAFWGGSIFCFFVSVGGAVLEVWLDLLL